MKTARGGYPPPIDSERVSAVFWKTIARWALLAIAVPIAAAGLRRLGQQMEARKGQTRMTGLIRKTASGLDVISGRDARRELVRQR
jgi:hypothetical protein